jgi:hypothetical protein
LQPDSVNAFVHEDRIIVSWNDPAPNGSPLLGYKLYFNVHGSTTEFAEETTECLGQTEAVLNDKYCEVHFSTLTSAPFNLVLDEQVLVGITANNVYGDSEMSEPTLAGLIQLVPDAPVNLENDATTTDATIIRFTWSDGPSDGGSPVLDYNIYYNQGANVDSVV